MLWRYTYLFSQNSSQYVRILGGGVQGVSPRRFVIFAIGRSRL